MTTGAYIIAVVTASVTAVKNKDPFLTIFGINDEHFTNFYRVVALLKRQIYKRGIYAWAY
jgi:hypothetical protein